MMGKYFSKKVNLLKVNEIFYSLQGETLYAGFPSLFIRLSGCNLNCRYCDTKYASEKFHEMSVEQIAEIADSHKNIHHMTITGGEPLAQENINPLINALINKSYLVQIETNGSISLEGISSEARIILDVKTPSSGEADTFLLENINELKSGDEVKFVIGTSIDYDYSVNFINKHLSNTKAIINFSPVAGMMPFSDLANMIIRDKLNVRLNLQLHKIIWDDEPRNSLIIDEPK